MKNIGTYTKAGIAVIGLLLSGALERRSDWQTPISTLAKVILTSPQEGTSRERELVFSCSCSYL